MPPQDMAGAAPHGDAWAAAREHHQMLLIAMQRGVPASKVARPPGFAGGGSRKAVGSQGAKK